MRRGADERVIELVRYHALLRHLRFTRVPLPAKYALSKFEKRVGPKRVVIVHLTHPVRRHRIVHCYENEVGARISNDSVICRFATLEELEVAVIFQSFRPLRQEKTREVVA